MDAILATKVDNTNKSWLKVINKSCVNSHCIDYQMENLTSKVSEQLKSVGKSKSELAAHLNVSEYGLTKMLKRGTLKSDTMIKMVKILNVDLSFFGINNTGGKGDSISSSDDSSLETKVEYLERVIATKDEVIRAKDEIIATLREKIKK